MQIISDLAAPDYHDHPAASAGRLKHLLRSPAHYRASYLEEKPPSAAMQFGSAFHAWMEGVFWDHYIQEPEGIDKRTKAGKEAWSDFVAEAGDKNLINRHQISAIEAMAESVHAHAKARELLEGQPEVSVFWEDTASGIECKCRPDRLIEDLDGLRVVVDYKTTEDASEIAFTRQALNLGYPLAAAHYIDGSQADAFIWIAVEKSAPYAVNCYYASPEILRYGEDKRRYCLTLLRQCQETGEWPGYPQTLLRLELPYWAK